MSRAYLLARGFFAVLCAVSCTEPSRVFGDEVASLYSTQGTVEKRFASGAIWNPAAVGNQFEAGNACRTALNSRGALLFVDGILVRMNENTLIEFKPIPGNEKRQPLRVESGSTYFLSREPKRFPQIETPVVSAAVRGTEFSVDVTSNQTIVSVMNGEVECSNAFGASA